MVSLLSELRRRRVFRTAVLYIIAAWVIVQVASELFPGWNIPEAAIRYVWYGVAIGFPLALIFGWYYNITSAGVVRTQSLAAGETFDPPVKRVDIVLLGALVLVIGAITIGVVDRILEVAPPDRSIRVAQELHQKGIAVLPFVNRSEEAQNAYFADGIHDDLLMLLSKIKDMSVISRTSVDGYRDTTKSMPDIGRELGVRHILEGAVQRAEDRVRITVQLIDAWDDEHLWAETYDRDLTATDIFAIQTEIATTIADQLQATLSQDERARISTTPTKSLRAYEAYLLGKQRLERRTTDSLAEALDYFKEAIELDPEFALAYVGLADTYAVRMASNIATADEVEHLRRAALQQALELDDQLGELHASLAPYTAGGGDMEGADAQYKLAISLSPNNAGIYARYGRWLSNQGRVEEGLAISRRGVMLDPLSVSVNFNIGHDYMNLGRYEEGEAQYKKVIEIDPDFAMGYRFIGSANWFGLGRLYESVRWYRRSLEIDPGHPIAHAWLSGVYLDLGDIEQAEIYAKKAFEIAPKSFWPNILQAALNRYRGDMERSEQYTRKVVEMNPRFWEIVTYQRDFDLRAGRLQDARAMYAAGYPELFDEDGPTVNKQNFHAAIDSSLVLIRTGETDLAEKFQQGAWEVIRDRARLGFYNGYWLADAEIYAINGQKKEALAALRQAYEEGWRFFWWNSLNHNLNFESLHGETAFEDIKTAITADMVIQLARVNELRASGEIPPPP